ncbi:MAG: hypothetical protein ACLQGT_00830 [Terracidiphilus sp.]
MKPVTSLLVLLALACALPSRALRLEPETNHSDAPQPVVDIEDESHVVVAHLFVMPGETMQLDSDDQKPAAGAGYYEAMPGEDYLLLIPAKFQLPRLGRESCPCLLRMDKIGWNRQGAVTTVAGLRPYLETASGGKIAIVSDVKHLRLAAGKFYFRLQGRGSSEYWVLTRYGQVVDTGGPWGLWELLHFFFVDLLPLALLIVLGFSVAGAIRLWREDSYPEKSFLELIQLGFLHLPLVRKIRGERVPEEVHLHNSGNAS